LIVARRAIVVISQLPPPTHGSTIVTKILIDVLGRLEEPVQLVDRRFSTTVGEVGSLSLHKVLAVPSLLWRLLVALSGRPSMCIFFCTNRPFSFLVDVMLGEALRLFRVPTVNYIHTRGYSELAARGVVWRILVSRLVGNAKRTVCLSPTLVSDVAEYVDASSISVIRNTAEVPVPLPQRSVDGPVLFLSNLLAEKGADVFVDMAILLCARSAELTFALVGSSADPGLTDALKRQVRDAGLGDRIRFEGPLFGQEKWNRLAQSRLLVFPTRYRFEAQPLTIIEAFSCGVPVVASDVGAIGELVNSSNGELLDEVTGEEAAAVVLKLLGDEPRLRAVSLGARASFERDHSLSVFTAAWASVIDLARK
jgi:glycosyltransferase involved in cell wall biosynthesis